MKAVAKLFYLAGELRPSDIVEDVGYTEGSFYILVYEHKLDRYRLVCEEFDELWRELLKDEEIRRWLLEIVKRYGEELSDRKGYRWRLNDI